jgi:hypothetical protein
MILKKAFASPILIFVSVRHPSSVLRIHHALNFIGEAYLTLSPFGIQFFFIHDDLSLFISLPLTTSHFVRNGVGPSS